MRKSEIKEMNMSESGKKSVSEELLKILVCPICKVDVVPVNTDSVEGGLHCPECNRIYPIKDGILIMLPDEARIKN